MRKHWFGLLCISLAILPSGAQDLEWELAGLYLKEALSTSDEDTSRFLIRKALGFDPTRSDILYWSALRDKDSPEERLPLLKKAMEMNNWSLVPPHRGLALYLETLIELRQFSLLLREVFPFLSTLDLSPDLLYPYIVALKAEGKQEVLESAIQTAWLLYQSDTRFWGFFLERGSYFRSFFNYLKQVRYFPTSVLHNILTSLPSGEAERHALLILLKDRSEEDLTLTLHLSLNRLITQDEALYLLKARGEVRDLKLLKQFYDSLQDPLLREEYEEWINQMIGSFYWISEGAQEVDNWVSVVNGTLMDWSYINDKGGKNIVSFRDAQPANISMNREITVEYGVYPFVISISVKKGSEEKVYSLGAGLLSLPLVKSTYLSTESIPFFLPLQTNLISYDLQESFWMPYVIKVEVFEGDDLSTETDYLYSKPIRKSFVNSKTGKFDRWDFYDNGVLTSVQKDIDGDGYPEVLVVYNQKNKGRYTLLDIDKDGMTDYLYYQDLEGIVEYWDWFDRGKIDTILIKPANNSRPRLIPLSSPEASSWRIYPKFQLRER